MSFSFTCDERRIWIEAHNVSLALDRREYGTSSWRDTFIRTVKHPRAALMSSHDSQLKILKNISITIRDGERVAILGVNGAGKTTLCRCLAGGYNPTRGSVRRFGAVRAVFDTQMGMYPELTGRENGQWLVHFLYPQFPHLHAELLRESFEFSELGADLDRPFRTYSNGMQARLSLSLLSALPSDVLILDEVIDGADQFFRAKLAERFRSLIERSGALIFISHSAEQVVQLCDRAIVLEGGQVMFDGGVNAAISYYNGTFADGRGDEEYGGFSSIRG